MSLLSWDKKYTEMLRIYGKPHLKIWKFVAARGFYFFAIPWIIAVTQGWMRWFAPLIPLVPAYVTLLTLQAIIKRERPDFMHTSDYRMFVRTYSFPSGHATASAAFAASLIAFSRVSSLSLSICLGVFVIILALLISYSRIVVGVHYFLDVCAGLVLGTMFVVGFGMVVG